MRAVIFLIFVIVIVFSAVPSLGSTYSPDWNARNGGGGSPPGLQPPSISYTPIPNPSPPSFPANRITIGGGNVTILFWNISTPSITFYVPDLNNLPGFLLGYAEYIFEWIAVQVANFGLALVQAFYFIFAYIEYIVLNSVIQIAGATGVFALPMMVMIVMAVGMIVSLVIHLAKDVTVVGAV